MMTPLELKQQELARLEAEYAALESSPITPKSKSFTDKAMDYGKTALDKLGQFGEFVDSYTGAPTRAAIGELQEDALDPIRAGKAFTKQFGQDPKKAPTGKDIAVKAGVSTKESLELPLIGKFSPAGAAGLATDILADPTNIVPIGAAAKLTGKGALKGSQLAGKVTSKVAPPTIRAMASGVDYMTSTKGASKTVDATGKTIKDATEALTKRFTPSRAMDYKEMSAIARKNGIDPRTLPEAVEFGKGSFISRASRKEAEGVMGEVLLQKHEAAVDQVNNAFRNRLGKMSERTMSAPEAGRFIRDSYDEAVDKVFDQIDITYSTAGQQVPGLNIKVFLPEAYNKLEKSLDAIETQARQMVDYGITGARRTQGQQLQKAVDIIRKSDGDYNTMVDQLREIGEAAFKSNNILADIPPDIKKLRKLYFDTQDTLIETTRGVMGDEAADQLILNNKFIHDFLTDKSVISKTIGSKNLADEKVFQQLLSNGDTKKVEALTNVLGADKIKELKSSFVDSLIKENIEGKMGYKSVYNSLRNKKDIVSKILDPQEIVDLEEILKLGDRMDIPIMSTSGTGASQSFGSVARSIPESMVNQKIIDKMKAVARKNKTPPTPRGDKLGASLTTPRAPLEKGAKAAQTYSVQKKAAQTYSTQKENERRNKQDVLRNLLKQYEEMQ